MYSTRCPHSNTRLYIRARGRDKINRWTEKQTYKEMDGWVDEWMGGWMDGWKDGWLEGWTDGWMDVSACYNNTRECMLLRLLKSSLFIKISLTLGVL